jgi:prophage regulatory protein
MSKAKAKPAHARLKSRLRSSVPPRPPREAIPPTSVRAAVNELLLEPEVMSRCRMSRSQIWKLEQADQFPKRKRYGFRRVAWVAGEIDAWLASGIDAWVAGQAVGTAA